MLRKQLKGTACLLFNLLVYLEIMQNDDIGASIGLENDDNFFLWNIVFEGPTETLYEVSNPNLK